MTNNKRTMSMGVALALLAAACGNETLSGSAGGNASIEVVRGALTSGTTQINCGSSSAVGGFVADTDVSGGTSVSLGTIAPLPDATAALAGFAPDAVYNTGRSGASTYTLPGFNVGAREVIRLHFIERQKTALGQRKFNVLINNVQVLTNYDIFVNANGANKRVVREFTAGADLNGKITIKLVAVTDQPIVSGIEAVASPLPQATQIACGQPAIGAFADDVGFSTGTGTKMRTNVITPTGVLHAGPAALYDNQRFGSAFSYTVPGFPSGSTNTVRLHFAETHFTSAGQRRFSVKINGVQVITDIDLFVAGGANTPIVREFRANARPTNDYLIEFAASLDAATISGIEVLPNVPWSMRTGMTSADYQAEFNARTANGYRLTYVDGYTVNGTTMFSAIFDLTAGPVFSAQHNMTPAAFQTQDDAFKASGFHLKLVNGYAVGSSELYAAIWEQGSLPSRIQHHSLSNAQWQADFNTQVAAGLKLVHLSGFASGGTDHYAAIWDTRDNGNAWSNQANLTEAQLTTALAAPGNRVLDLTSYNVAGTQRYAVTLEQSAAPKPPALQRTLSRADFQQRQLDLYRQGYAPLLVTATAPSSGNETYAALWQNVAFTQADLDSLDAQANAIVPSAVPSLTFANTKNGRLVFAKAWGLADGVNPATTSSLYRIMSISKTITSSAIQSLVDRGLLNLDATVFGANGLLGMTYQPYGAGVTSITVRQLLSHTAGMCPQPPNAACPNDGLIFDGTKLSWGFTQLIQGAVASVSPPGMYHYSNMDYVILGRVIEKIVGSGTYADWVNANILQPSGITDMQIAGSTLADRKPNEVTYTPASAYGYNIPRMDAHGGWLATATDLVRYYVHVDGLPTVPDLLSASSTTMMFNPVVSTDGGPGLSATSNYALGWVNQVSIIWHDGDLAGTQAFLMRHTDGARAGTIWAADTNTSGTNVSGTGDTMANLPINWPLTDFFLDQ